MGTAGKPAPPALLVAPAFVEPFLKACPPALLLAASETCKTWMETARRDQQSLWRALVLSRYPYSWLQCDSQDDCNWLERYKMLSRGVPTLPVEPQLTDVLPDYESMLKDLQESYSFFLTSSDSDEAPTATDDTFALPLHLHMMPLNVETEYGGHEVPHGLVLTTKNFEPPLHLPTNCDGHLTRDFTIYVKSKKDLTIAQLITLKGWNFYDEGDGYMHWEIERRRSPEWLSCIVHGNPTAGTGANDEFQPMLHDGRPVEDWNNVENDDAMEMNEDLGCKYLMFEFRRATAGLKPVVDYPGYAIAEYVIPMCVGDMPDILDKLTWA